MEVGEHEANSFDSDGCSSYYFQDQERKGNGNEKNI